LRSRHREDPTLDPVELERQRIAAARAESDTQEGRIGGWAPHHRLAIFVSLALAAVYLVLWATAVQANGGPEGYVRVTDFMATLTGSTIVREGDGALLYDPQTQSAVQKRLISAGPSSAPEVRRYDRLPFEALILAPLADFPLWIPFALWTLLAGLGMGLSIGLMDGALPVSRQVGWVLSLAACSYLPAIRSLMLGQDSLFVLMGLCGTYHSIKRRSEAGAALGLLLVALRPEALPPVLLLLVLERYWRALAIFLALLAVLGTTAMVALGPGWPIQYLQLLFSPGGRDPALAPALAVALAVGALLAVAWAWLRTPGYAPADAETEDDEYDQPHDLLWAIAGLAATLTSLYHNPYDLTLLIFPAWIAGAYAASGLWSAGLSRTWTALLWLGYFLAPLTFYAATTVQDDSLPVVPSVLLIVLALGLLVWQASTSRLDSRQPV
jgi:hypothetical protein